MRIYDVPGEGLYDKICSLSPAELWRSGFADVAVISPKAADWAHELMGQCRVLLLPGNVRRCPIQAQCAVSYGLSQRDSITLSSMSGGNCVIALQREILGADRCIIEPQEFTVNGVGEPELTLAVYGAALILGGVGI